MKLYPARCHKCGHINCLIKTKLTILEQKVMLCYSCTINKEKPDAAFTAAWHYNCRNSWTPPDQ